ncbi:VanZ family protein [Goodfellowiella coeruleoviolacea]|uniref:VanZ family protein n=1 Tax=Goodfellowiella coeruleoviolacea TaxID=334858 RepID=UPI0020A2CEEA|nr:VanZ family protein [Goodfellowiella coeruleoviolacea]
MLLSVVVLFTPESGVPSAPPGTDKLVHAGLFALLAITGYAAGIVRTWQLAVLLLGYAAGSEVLQSLLPIGRDGDVLDALTDVVGAAVGLAGCLVGAVVARGNPVTRDARSAPRGQRTTR